MSALQQLSAHPVTVPTAFSAQQTPSEPTTVPVKIMGPTAAPGQTTTLPAAFTAAMLYDPATGAWNMDTDASSHLNSSVTNLNGIFNTCMYTSITDFMTRRVLLRCNCTGDLYPVTTPSPIPQALLVSQHMWHKRLGHPGSEVLLRLVSNNFISCNKEKPPALCHACQLGKQREASIC
nr:ribonuclease H-like domain-containing protein [Tanacetum cinerariifolium]